MFGDSNFKIKNSSKSEKVENSFSSFSVIPSDMYIYGAIFFICNT